MIVASYLDWEYLETKSLSIRLSCKNLMGCKNLSKALEGETMKKQALAVLFFLFLFTQAETLQAYDLSGTLMHAGAAMSTKTSVEPTFWFRDEATGTTYEGATASYSNSTGAYEINNLSGTIGISIVFHVTGSRVTLPGNYRLWKTVDETTPAQQDIEMPVIIHITNPWDNGVIRAWIPPYPYYPSPITFEWDEVQGATRYDIHIRKCYAWGCANIITASNLSNTSYRQFLPNVKADESYSISVQAFYSGELIGTNLTTFEGGYGSHKFKTRSLLTSPMILLLDKKP
jgi:hypothetical protein